MRQMIGTLADRVLAVVVPTTQAAAACSGTYSFCGGYCGACWMCVNTTCWYRTCYYKCTVKPNCTDSCSAVACDC